MRPRIPRFAILSTALLLAAGARAELPTFEELAARFDLSKAELQRAKDGEFVTHSVPASNDRELTDGFLFVIAGRTPSELVEVMRGGQLDKVDPNVQAFGFIEGEPGPEDFAGLTLDADTAKSFASAEAGGGMNLSEQELAAFQELGSSDHAAVEAEVRRMLLARTKAYRAQGLAGIAPYARGRGKVRSAADDLRSASQAMEVLAKEAPAALRLLLEYPEARPENMQETLRWSLMTAHGTPTLVLTHGMAVPYGDSWIGVQRQFYVSTGYNCEQALGTMLPVAEGTAVYYANRTSTDQVEGFGGSAKRSIGSKLLARQLQDLFTRLRSSGS